MSSLKALGKHIIVKRLTHVANQVGKIILPDMKRHMLERCEVVSIGEQATIKASVSDVVLALTMKGLTINDEAQTLAMLPEDIIALETQD